MFGPVWSKLVLRAPGNFRKQPALRRIGPVALHAERLEDRLLMSANKSSIERASTKVSSKVDPQVPALAARAAAATATPVAAPNLNVVESGWEQFGSKAAFETWLVDAATAKWGNLFGQTYGGWNSYMRFGVVTDELFLASTNSAVAAADLDFSSTNLQVAGVDEADLIETDGSYLYIISGNDLVIVQAGVGDDLRVMSRVHLGERPTGMFLSGDRLAIVSTKGETSYHDARFMLFADINPFGGYEPSPPTTTVAIFDIGDRVAPTLVRKTEMDGRLIASRMVDGELRLVLNNPIQLPELLSWPVEPQLPIVLIEAPALVNVGDMITMDLRWSGQYGQEYVYETRDQYVARVRDEMLKSFQPRTRSLAGDGSVLSDRPLFDPAALYRPDSLFEQSVTTIATFDLASNRRGPVATSSVMTLGDVQVYATVDSIYLFSTQPIAPDAAQFAPGTRIFKFNMQGGRHGVTLAAKGNVDGTLLNQFAADEQDGFLRIVTQNGSWSPTGHSLQVLQQVGRRLEVVGSVDGIAPQEQLYSVRFVGERAFFVTFRQVDPLFAVDLSDPTDPRLMGELKIPGYSDYLQPIDDTHLLAIGRGADERTSLFQDLQVSIFDVSDLANPQLVQRYSFEGGRSTTTPATGDRWIRGDGDHHSVSYFADEQILALPVFSAEANWWSPTGEETGTLFPVGQGGLQVFKIDAGAGITPIGVIEHDSLVERSVRIGDRLFAISSDAVSVHQLTDPAAQLGEVSIAAPPNEQAIAPIEGPFVLKRASRELLAASPLKVTTSQPTFKPAAPPTPATPVGWASPSLVRSRHAQPARPAVPGRAITKSRVDEALITLLAEDNAASGKYRDESPGIMSWTSNKLDAPERFAGELQLALSDLHLGIK